MTSTCGKPSPRRFATRVIGSNAPSTANRRSTTCAAGGKPGLILLDLMMPRMSGAEFRMVQKVDPQLCGVPVVLLSADGRMEEKARVLETDGAIKKPIDLDELLERDPALQRQ